MNVRFENLFKTFLPITNILDELDVKYFIAGGCIKDYFRNQSPKDIDIFFKTQEDLETVLKHFANQDSEIVVNNDKVVKIKHKDSIYDLIKMLYPDVITLLESFDFTIAQFAITSDKEFFYTEEAFQDLTKRQLMLNSLPYPESTMIRVRKYMNNGFNICHEELNKIIFAIRNRGVSMLENNLKFDFDNTLAATTLKQDIEFHQTTIRKYTKGEDTQSKSLNKMSKLIKEYVGLSLGKKIYPTHITIDDVLLREYGFKLEDEDITDADWKYEFYGID